MISKPPADRLVCDALTARPSIPREYRIDWTVLAANAETASQTLDLAKTEHEKVIVSIRNREDIIAGHIVAIEGNWFSCSDDVQFNKAFFGAQE